MVGTPKNHPMTWGYRSSAAEGGTDVTEFYDLAENLPLKLYWKLFGKARGRTNRPQHAGHPRADQGRRRGMTAEGSIELGRPAILVVLHPGTPVTGARDADRHRTRTCRAGRPRARGDRLIRPALQSDGGDIVFHDLDDDGVVHVTLVGACGTCPVSMMTLKAGVERIIMDRVPGVTEVVDDSE